MKKNGQGTGTVVHSRLRLLQGIPDFPLVIIKKHGQKKYSSHFSITKFLKKEHIIAYVSISRPAVSSVLFTLYITNICDASTNRAMV